MNVKIFLIFYCKLLYTCFYIDYNHAEIIDLTKECKNNLTLNYFLTYGMGSIDGTVITMHSDSKECTIRLHSDSKAYNSSIVQIIVVQSLQEYLQNKINHLENILILDERNNVRYISYDTNERGEYVGIYYGNLTTISLRGKSVPIKIIASCARRTQLLEKCTESETKCRLNQQNYCIDNELMCDGNINCGQTLYYDESPSICYTDNKWSYTLLILTSCVIIVFLILVLTKLICKLIPKIPNMHFHASSRDTNSLLTAKSHITTTKKLKSVNPKSTRIIVKGNIIETSSEEYPEEAHRKSKRKTTNSPVAPRQFTKKKLREEILFLANTRDRQHRLKKGSSIFYSS